MTPDGQTVVIGGLMQKSKRQSVSKIPLLGDIPVIGAAFRRTIKDGRRTELLIFLTPYVVRDPSETALLTEREKAGNSVVPRESSTEKELNQFLDRVPTADPDSPPPGKSKK